MRHSVCYPVWFAAALVARGSLAQSAERTAAVSLFDEAGRLVAEGDLGRACPKYAESYRLDPQLGALLHLADCYERAGKLASAWSSFRDASELARQRGDARAKIATEHAAALEPTLPRLKLLLGPDAASGVQVQSDGKPVGAAALGGFIAVDPGEHSVEASAPAHHSWQARVNVRAGQEVVLEIPALAPLAPPEPGN